MPRRRPKKDWELAVTWWEDESWRRSLTVFMHALWQNLIWYTIFGLGIMLVLYYGIKDGL